MSILIVATLIGSGTLSIALAQEGLPRIPLNELLLDCVPFPESPLSLKDIKGVTSPGFFNPDDLDADGWNNFQELQAFSDPTDSASTPVDVDGDGEPKATDRPELGGCDYDVTLPREIVVSVSVSPTTSIRRTDSFIAQVETKNKVGVAIDVDEVRLRITKSSGNNETGPLVDRCGVGCYRMRITTLINDAADDAVPWIIDAVARLGSKTATVPQGQPDGPVKDPVNPNNGDKRARITVRPITDLPVELVICAATGPCDRGTPSKTLYFANEVFRVRAFPRDPALCAATPNSPQCPYFNPLGPVTRSATLSYTASVVVADVPHPSKTMTPQGAIGVGPGLFWETTINPNTDFLPHLVDPASLLFTSTTFRLSVTLRDDAPMNAVLADQTIKSNANSGTALATVIVRFQGEFKIIVEPIADKKRTDDLQIVVRLQKRNAAGVYENHNDPTASDAKAHVTYIDPDDPTGLFTVPHDFSPLPLVYQADGSYRLATPYQIKIGDPAIADPVSGFTSQPWFVNASLVKGSSILKSSVADSRDFNVDPIEVEGTLTVSDSSDPGETVQAGLDATMSPTLETIHVVWQLTGTAGVDFFEDPADADTQPGTAELIVRDGNGVQINTLGQRLPWTGTQFEGDADIEPVVGLVTPGEWTVEVRYRDDANVPNFGGAGKTIKVESDEGVTVRVDPASAIIDEVYGYNVAAYGTGGLYGNNAFDRDAIGQYNAAGELVDGSGDGKTTSRFVIVSGRSTPQRIILSQGGESVTIDRPIGGVFVNYNQRTLRIATSAATTEVPGPLSYYQQAEIDSQGAWKVIFDNQGPGVGNLACASGFGPLQQQQPICSSIQNAAIGHPERRVNYGLTPTNPNLPISAFAFSGPVVRTPELASGSRWIASHTVVPPTYVAGDPTGTFSPLSTVRVNFTLTGPSSTYNAGVRNAAAGGGTIDMMTNGASSGAVMMPGPGGDIVWLIKWSDPNSRAIAASQIAVSRIDAQTTCDGNNGNDWCLRERYSTSAAPATGLALEEADNALFNAMTPDDALDPLAPQATPQSFRAQLRGPFSQGLASPDANSERFWVRVRSTTVDGYTFESTSPLSPTTHNVLLPTLPSGTGRQFTWLTHETRPSKADVFELRPANYRAAGAPVSWEEPNAWGSPANPKQPTQLCGRALDSNKCIAIHGFLEGDEFNFGGIANINATGTNDEVRRDSIRITVTRDPTGPNNDIEVLQATFDPLHPRGTSEPRLFLKATQHGTNVTWNATLDISNLPEQFGVYANTEVLRISVYSETVSGIKEERSKNFLVDRNSPPVAALKEISAQDVLGNIVLVAAHDNVSASSVGGALKFRLEGFDLDGVGPVDARRLDGVEAAFSFLKQGAQQELFLSGPRSDPSMPDPGRQTITFAMVTQDQVSEVCLSSPARQGCATGVSYYFPLRVGFNPLFLNVDPGSPGAHWFDQSQKVFGLDTSHYGESGTIRIEGDSDWCAGYYCTLFTPRQWNSLAVHAIELTLADEGSDCTSITEDACRAHPYIGFTTGSGWRMTPALRNPVGNGNTVSAGSEADQNDVHFAIATDRGFTVDPTGWRPNGEAPGTAPPSMTPTEWGVIDCLEANILAASAAGRPSDCTEVEDYQWLGIANGLTPLTVYYTGPSYLQRSTSGDATQAVYVTPWGVGFTDWRTGGPQEWSCENSDLLGADVGPIMPLGQGYPSRGEDNCATYDTRSDFTGLKQDGDFQIPRGFVWQIVEPIGGALIPVTPNSSEFLLDLETLWPVEAMRMPSRTVTADLPALDKRIADGTYVLTARGIDNIELFPADNPSQPNDRGPLTDITFIVDNDADDDSWSGAFERKIRRQIDGTYGFPQNLAASPSPDQIVADLDGRGTTGAAGQELLLPVRGGATLKFRDDVAGADVASPSTLAWTRVYADVDNVLGFSAGDPFVQFQNAAGQPIAVGQESGGPDPLLFRMLVDRDGTGHTGIVGMETLTPLAPRHFWNGNAVVTGTAVSSLGWHTISFDTDAIPGVSNGDVFLGFQKNERHRQFVGGYPNQPGVFHRVGNALPIDGGSIVVRDYEGRDVTIRSENSTPCDWDGDGVPNDVNCLGLLNLENLFRMDPFIPDSPMGDNNRNGIPNVIDPTQTYNFGCRDSDTDTFCDEQEDLAGSDKNDPKSVPNDRNGNGIPDTVEDGPLGTGAGIVGNSVCLGAVAPACPHTFQATLPTPVNGIKAAWAEAVATGRVKVGVTISDNSEVTLLDSNDLPGAVAAVQQILQSLACVQGAGATECPHFLTVSPPEGSGGISHVYVDANAAARTFSIGTHTAAGHNVILSSAQIDDVRAFIEAAAAGLVCVGPTASCPHTVMVVTPAEVPTLRNLYVDVVTGTAPSVTIGMNGAKVASTNDAVGAVMLVIALAQSTACSTTGKTPGALGPVDCVSATVMDPDGDGYTTDNELLSNTNPLHKNSSPRNRGAGFLLDWDGDGYTNDYELLANGDPLHECSTPANRRGIVVSC